MTEFLSAFRVFLDPMVPLSTVIGVVLGITGGCLPGISPSMTIALLLPVSLYMPTMPALTMLLGAYEGAMFGGSISAILINTPGTASAAATTFDGYPMAQAGKAGKALRVALYASCTGGAVGVLILILSAQLLAKLALKFGPPEYFSLMLLALTLVAGVGGKSLLKGLLVTGLGLLLTSVGMDPIFGTPRFTFGVLSLFDGFALLPVFIGLFALSEILIQLCKPRANLDEKPAKLESKENRFSLKEYLGQLPNIVISGILGCIIGALPGLGGSTAAFFAYGESKRRSKYPEKYGTGIVDGVAAPEAANNGVCGGALIPMLTLGIPGDVVTAILAGAFIAHGLKPGPLLFTERIKEVYGIYIGMLFAIAALAVIGILSILFFSKVVSIRKSKLFPVIFIICIVGTYAYNGSLFDCYVMLVFGILGFLLRLFQYPLSPLVIAFILGRDIEANFRVSMRLLNYNAIAFFTRPLTAVFIILTITLAAFLIRRNYAGKTA